MEIMSYSNEIIKRFAEINTKEINVRIEQSVLINDENRISLIKEKFRLHHGKGKRKRNKN